MRSSAAPISATVGFLYGTGNCLRRHRRRFCCRDYGRGRPHGQAGEQGGGQGREQGGGRITGLSLVVKRLFGQAILDWSGHFCNPDRPLDGSVLVAAKIPVLLKKCGNCVAL
jgi:hypothetical protein